MFSSSKIMLAIGSLPAAATVETAMGGAMLPFVVAVTELSAVILGGVLGSAPPLGGVSVGTLPL